MVIRFRGFDFDPETYRLQRGEEDVPLRPKVVDLLAHLVRHRARVVHREELVRVVWGHTNVGAGSLSGLMNELRQALGEGASGGGSIRTVHARGYQFVAPVEEGPAEAATSALRIVGAQGGDGDQGSASADVRAIDAVVATVAERGALGVLVDGDAAGGEEGVLGRARAAGFEVHRVPVPDLSPLGAARFASRVVASLRTRRGHAEVARVAPLPVRGWFDALGESVVAGGTAPVLGPLPGGLSALASMLEALSRMQPIVLAIDDVDHGGVEFARSLVDLVDRLGEAVVLFVVGRARVSSLADSTGRREEGAEVERILASSGPFVRVERERSRARAGVSDPPPKEAIRVALVETLERFGLDREPAVEDLVDSLCEAASGRGHPARPRLRRVVSNRDGGVRRRVGGLVPNGGVGRGRSVSPIPEGDR